MIVAQTTESPLPTSEDAAAPVISGRPFPAEVWARQGSDEENVEMATEAYLAQVPPEARARSDAYFEGGYWLILWGFLYAVLVYGGLLRWRVSARMRDLARTWTSGRGVTVVYWLMFISLTTLAFLPWSIYEDFIREHQYGLSNQTFAEWLTDRGKGFAMGALFGAIAIPLFYWVIRRTGRRWWIWGTAVVALLMSVTVTVMPVYIAPVFNKYEELEAGPIRTSVLNLANANGIDTDAVYRSDASRQSKRISANVSGMFATQRITLNDNLLQRCSLAEIEAVMGHEIGHYALNHIYKGLVAITLLLAGGFAFVAWGFRKMTSRFGNRWGIHGTDDPAGLPLIILLLMTYLFLMTPVTNTITRVQEYEADLFGLNAARRPDGFAEVSLKLGEYRKLDPSPLEEVFFFDHPSGRTRIHAAMRWKAHLARP